MRFADSPRSIDRQKDPPVQRRLRREERENIFTAPTGLGPNLYVFGWLSGITVRSKRLETPLKLHHRGKEYRSSAEQSPSFP